MSIEKTELEEQLDLMNSPLTFVAVIGSIVLALTLGDTWRTISGVFAPWTQVVFAAYFIVATLGLRNWAMKGKTDSIKIFAMICGVVAMYSPALYLLVSGQLDAHAVVFSEFDPSLNHMPYAEFLPVIAIAALFIGKKER